MRSNSKVRQEVLFALVQLCKKCGNVYEFRSLVDEAIAQSQNASFIPEDEYNRIKQMVASFGKRLVEYKDSMSGGLWDLYLEMCNAIQNGPARITREVADAIYEDMELYLQ